jgi:hypothetical protein
LLGITGGKKVTTKTKRWYKDVGLGFRTPAGEYRRDEEDRRGGGR